MTEPTEPRYISDTPPPEGMEEHYRIAPDITQLDFTELVDAGTGNLVLADAVGAAYGVDIYDRYQDWPDPWASARNGTRFVIIKASDGGNRALYPADGLVRAARSVTGSLAIQTGLYHYAQPSSPPERQAQVLMDEVNRLDADDLWPVLDLEGAFHTMDLTLAVNFAQRFVTYIRARTGGAMLYANTSFLSRLAPDTWRMPWLRIWAANYGPNDGRRHPLPPRWAGVPCHQFTDRLLMPGITGLVDGNWSPELSRITTEQPTLPIGKAEPMIEHIPVLERNQGYREMTLPFALAGKSMLYNRAWFSLAGDEPVNAFEIWFQGAGMQTDYQAGTIPADGRWWHEVPGGTECIVLKVTSEGSVGLMIEAAPK